MVHHEIVALERIHQPLPLSFDFPPGATYNLTTYDRPDASKLRERLRPATIVIVTTINLDAAILSEHVTPNLQHIAVMATGTDIIDFEACKRRGIRVTNCPAANLDCVSEHTIGLYFAARRRTIMLDRAIRGVPSEWKEKKTLTGRLRFADGQPPLTCGNEIMGIIGYGNLGKRVAALGRSLGMQVLIASRKNTALSDLLPTQTLHGERLPFDDVIRRSTVLILSLPRNPQTLNLMSTPEYEKMSPYAVLVNISRGGIVNEAALVEALKQGQIAGYATDVFEKEPLEGPEDSVLLSEEAKDLNITMSPHLAWFSQRTLSNLGQILKDTIEASINGEPINVIV